MNKLQMAHDFAMKCVGNPDVSLITIEDIVEKAWKYANAMQAEADKCEKAEEERRVTESRKFFESMTGEMKDHVHDYLYGRVCACGAVKNETQ